MYYEFSAAKSPLLEYFGIKIVMSSCFIWNFITWIIFFLKTCLCLNLYHNPLFLAVLFSLHHSLQLSNLVYSISVKTPYSASYTLFLFRKHLYLCKLPEFFNMNDASNTLYILALPLYLIETLNIRCMFVCIYKGWPMVPSSQASHPIFLIWNIISSELWSA